MSSEEKDEGPSPLKKYAPFFVDFWQYIVVIVIFLIAALVIL